MGYTLCVLVGRADALRPVVRAVAPAVLVELGQGLSLLPLSEPVLDALTTGTPSEAIPPCYFLTAPLEAGVLQCIGNEAVGYLEAEYFGGQGAQSAVLWQGGRRHHVLGPAYGALNAVLRHLGVRPRTPDEDEFDAVHLGRHRHTVDWVPA